MAKAGGKKKVFRKKEKKNVPVGIVHIAASFNNTMISITDLEGNLSRSRRQARAVFAVRERELRSQRSRRLTKRRRKRMKPECISAKCA